jgi:excisionase family DNA binding protein
MRSHETALPTLPVQPLLSPEELSELLGVPVGTLYRWRHHGIGPPALKVGRHLRYRVDGVAAYLASLAPRTED